MMQTASPTLSSANISRVTWDEFADSFAWKQGEHVTVIGPTGQGKSHLCRELLPMRRYVVAVACKPQDELLNDFGSGDAAAPTCLGMSFFGAKADGEYRVTRKLPLASPDLIPRQMFWPPIEDARQDIPKQQRAIRDLLLGIYRTGGWTVYLDEGNYVTQFLRLSSICELLWRQGRSLGVTLVVATQRPFHIPLLAYDQATHLFFFRENDENNLRRISGIGMLDSKRVRDTVMRLGQHEVLYMNTRTGQMLVTKAPERGKGG